ncbi:MAG: hypothetical protein ABI634_01680 [Acidobacteriota bacterium]
MTPRFLSLLVLAALLTAAPASAQTPTPFQPQLRMSFLPPAAPAVLAEPLRLNAATRSDVFAPPDPQGPPRVAFEYSDAYHTRARIHRLASFATLPLFATEAVLGQSLYNSSTPGKKTAHLVVAGAIGGLFAVNSVTGVWNLIEARHDPQGRNRRLIHGILMLAADAGFLATAALGPSTEGRSGRVEGSPAAHRAVAFSSIGAATAGYLVMLIGGH